MIKQVSHTARATRGFTLIELSIVLVIIGLLVGGIMLGRELIRGATVRKAIGESHTYLTSINIFKLNYAALPGDMSNAYSFWGTGCGQNTSHVSNGCNGNGNWNWDGSNEEDWADGRKAWQHMGLAGILKTTYPGGAGGSDIVPGTNVPTSAFGTKSVWTFKNASGRNLLRLSGPNPAAANFRAYYSGVRPLDAMAIDGKIDDGNAAAGKVISLAGVSAPAACVSGALYVTTTDSISCMMYFYYYD